MPGSLHQALVALFDAVPSLLKEVLVHSELSSPLLLADDVVVESGSETVVVEPVELRADRVFQLEAGGRRLVVVFEVQLRRDADKRFAWVNYAAAAARQFQSAEVVVLVVTASDAVARWARRQTVSLTGVPIAPVVLGPADLTRLQPGSTAAALAVPALDLATRRVPPTAEDIAHYLLGLPRLDPVIGRAYVDLVLARLTPQQELEVEAIMTAHTGSRTPNFLDRAMDRSMQLGRQEGIREGREEGREEGARLEAERARAQVLATARALLPADVVTELAAIDDHETLVRRAFEAVAARGRHSS